MEELKNKKTHKFVSTYKNEKKKLSIELQDGKIWKYNSIMELENKLYVHSF